LPAVVELGEMVILYKNYIRLFYNLKKRRVLK
jgi:hypothetical protein